MTDQNTQKTINENNSNSKHRPHGDMLTIDELDQDLRERIHVIRREFIEGLNFVRQHKNTVTFYGSARFEEDNQYYQKAVRIAKMLAENGVDIVTGGGPGIMEAANRGAASAEGEDVGHSLGMNIDLPQEQVLNPYVEENQNFHYFFSRKVSLTFSAEAYIFFPGGFGTLDEFFEMATLVQTGKIKKVPILLVGVEFWQQLQDFIQHNLLKKFKTIDHKDLDLFHMTNDEEEVVRIAKEAPLRNE
jgi:uncharacterized protein (TIGR00730 family)